MCGIAGKIYFNNGSVTEADIRKMTDAIAHRGPDDQGVYISPDQKIGLGQRRLSIIDLSPLGHQPMRYKDRYWIVFNGEIYNYQQKRDMLQSEGYTFTSKTDTEVIMALYDLLGVGCLSHLRGMFAFVIYDEKEQTLFCARDRVGKKPFKYYLDDTVFLFASELKAILTQPQYHKEPDYEAIHHYLTYQYVPAPRTGFKNIQKLGPAHYLLIDLKTKKISTERYWRLDYSKKLSLSENQWQKMIMNKLEESVQLRMISDVPLGAFLSGGIDSSAVVALMSKNSSPPVKTFSIGFEEEKYNELKFAKIVAEKFKTDHTEFIVKPEKIDELLPMLVRQYEEPYADSSALPTYYVSKLTREHVTVALNGDGGDENFGGYERYGYQKKLLLLDNFKLLNVLLKPLAKVLPTNPTTRKIKTLSRILSQPYAHRYVNLVCFFTNELKISLYTDQFRQAHPDDSYDFVVSLFDQSGSTDKMDQTMFADFESYLPGALMPKVDIASMTVALEGRSPFLDHELLELSAQIPSDLKIKGLNNKKYILKKALEGVLPYEVMYRPKMGFGVPIEVWFKNELNRYAKDIVLSDKALSRGMFQKAALEKIFADHESGVLNHGYRIWSLLTLELWFREYFD